MYLSKSQKLLLLYSLKASLNMGITLQKAIELQTLSQKGKLKKILTKVNYLIVQKQKKTTEALYETGVINNEEKILLSNSKDPKVALNLIIETIELQGKFDKTLFSIIWFPLLAIILGMFLAYKLLPIFLQPFNNIIKIVEIKGIPTDGLKHFDSYLWYINYYKELPQYMMIYSVIVLGIILIYFYLRHYHSEYIYKIFPLSAYDDLPFILTYMKGLKQVGLPTKQIFAILANAKVKPTWKRLFVNLLRNVEKNKINLKFSYTFRRFGYPNEVINFLKYAEETNNFWENTENLIKFVKEKNEIGNRFFKNTVGKIATPLGYIILLYFLIGPILIMIKMQTIQSALM